MVDPDQLRWVQALEPTGEVYSDRLSEYSDVEALHIPVEFHPWRLPAGREKLTRDETYGCKPQVVPIYPRLDRSVGEVELAQRLRSAEMRAFWIDNFGSAPAIWKPWTCRANQLPAWIQDLDRQLRKHPAMQPYRTAGWPDVIAWREAGSEVRFVEYKGPSGKNPNKEDSVSEKQDAWCRAAMDLNIVPLTSYIVARWKPSPAAAAILAEQCDIRKRGSSE